MRNYTTELLEGPDGFGHNEPLDPQAAIREQERIAALASEPNETRWEIEEGWEVPTSVGEYETSMKVAQGEKCPECNDYGTVGIPERGLDTGQERVRSYPCFCQALHSWHFQWRMTVEPRYQGATFTDSLGVSDSSLLSPVRQQEIYDTLRDHPEGSYYLFGPAGTGKTHAAAALFAHALLDDVQGTRRARRCPASRLLDQTQRYRIDPKSPLPLVTEELVIRAYKEGRKFSLFLEEFDRWNPTLDRIECLKRIIDAVYDHEGQIVATSNRSLEGLVQRWTRVLPDSEEDAKALIRRIGGDVGCRTVEFR